MDKDERKAKNAASIQVAASIINAIRGTAFRKCISKIFSLVQGNLQLPFPKTHRILFNIMNDP
jgi:hypothetical protein